MLTYPHINPIALQIGPLSIHWYGVMYCGIFGRLDTGRYRAAQPAPLERARGRRFIFYACWHDRRRPRGLRLFYAGDVARRSVVPLKLWEGGMSFHGGFLGVLAAVALLRVRRRRVWDVADSRPAPRVGISRCASAISSTASCGQADRCCGHACE